MGQVITANRLSDGAVVFLDAAGRWSERLDHARIFADKAASALGLEAGRVDEARNLVLDLAAIDVTVQAGSIVPTKLREAIRARGPTIFPEFAKPGSAPPVVTEDDHVSV